MLERLSDLLCSGRPVLASHSSRMYSPGIPSFQISRGLTIPPVIPIEVEVEYNAGDDDISIVSGSILYFDSSNYDQPQTVVLAAAEDEDYDEGAGQVILSGSHSETITVFVHEVENDVRPGFVITGDEPIVIDEGGTASFAVALTDPPAGPITVAVVVETQDSNISVVSGSMSLRFFQLLH